LLQVILKSNSYLRTWANLNPLSIVNMPANVLQRFNVSIPEPALVAAKKLKKVFGRPQPVTTVEKPVETSQITLVQVRNQVNNVTRHSKQVVEALEHIGKIHPFVQGRCLSSLTSSYC
jgi:hypothetical protein